MDKLRTNLVNFYKENINLFNSKNAKEYGQILNICKIYENEHNDVITHLIKENKKLSDELTVHQVKYNIDWGLRHEKHRGKYIYFNVPYEIKDEGKTLGFRWCKKNRMWYINEQELNKSRYLFLNKFLVEGDKLTSDDDPTIYISKIDRTNNNLCLI